MNIKEELFSILENEENNMIFYRRYFHEHPELSFKEKNTSEYIYNFYKDKDVKVEKNIGGYGVKVTIDSKNPGKTIALRADFDALPILEQTNLEFKSKNEGVMHACGHDAHTAYLMCLADSLIKIKSKLKGKIVIIHQPAEEMPPGGASFMIKDGVLDGVDNVFGCHVMSQLDFGKIYYHIGATQQARAKFVINIHGKGGHGSSPHEANDAIVIASHLVLQLQNIVARRMKPFDSAVVTVGSFDGKGQFNIIKDSVTLEGDVRCMSTNAKKIIEQEIRKISKGLETSFNCKIDVDYKNDYPVLENDKDMTNLLVRAIKKSKMNVEIEDCGPQAPSEDFSYYTEVVPSSFFYVGAKKDGETFPHHHPKFDINEKCILICAKAMASIVLEYMNLLD